MTSSDSLTPIELEYLTVVNAAEAAPLYELAWDLAPRLSLRGQALVAVASRILADLIQRGVVGLERRANLDTEGVVVSVAAACDALAAIDNWTFPHTSPSQSWYVLFLTESGELYYKDGFEQLSQSRTQELLFGSKRGATRVPG